MPCEVIPCIVNNTCIFVEPRGSKLGNSSAMHETKAKVGPQNNMVWTQEDLRGRLSIDNDGSSYGRAQAPEGHTDMLENNITFHDINHRISSRPFSSIGHSGADIEECEQASSGHVGETNISFSRSRIPNCEPPRRYSSSSWPSETFMREYYRSRELSAHRANRRRQSEGFILSQNKVFGLVGYRNESDGQRSENHDPNTKVVKRERDSGSHKISHNISLASFNIMNSVATTALDRPANSYYSLPRRRSQPTVPSFGNDTTNNGKEQRNSLPTEDYLRQYHFDSDTELQWQRLVARAKTLQLSSPKRPEIICSRLTDSNNVQVSQKATKSTGDLERGADNLGGKERKIYEVKPLDKENNNSVQPTTMRRRRRNEERRYSLKMVPTSLESLSERNTSTCDDKLSEKEMEQTAGSRDKRLISQQRCMVNPIEATTRRHSVAVVRPVQQVNSEKISGYSTHGALEYAKMLMEKIQEAGKTKSKKERLEEMSKVLKIVLEELNRIEMPDRDLVSLFISLRAKMVNLRTELKVDEGKEMETEKQTSEQKIPSNSLPSLPVSHEEHIPAHPRRFSWI
ncbi:uncharacterized protein LOC110251719 [Exaiptasia diaphana]|uniref:Uncharacterized protein n=1 Tax=Exaiptasia diaphana TaxID=2652724 RepID=A0A913Y3G6_EXADI|nr:uncharacterized protein LOC110251719 [Exaiptasia diaphana]